jgi:hypothetical protein
MARKFGWPHRRALACCRTAYRVWRHWFETQEVRRLASIDALQLPESVARVIGGPRPLYRHAREAHRAGRPADDLMVLPESLRRALATIAAESTVSLQSRVAFEWTPPPLGPLASALVLSPLSLVASRGGVGHNDVSRAAQTTAASVLRMLTAAWPWIPRPVVHGPRRAWIKVPRWGAQSRPTRWTPGNDSHGRPANPRGQ